MNRISAQSSLLRVIRASLSSTEVQCGKNLKQLRTPCVHISTFDQTVVMGKGADYFPTSLLTSLLVPKIGRSNVMKGLFMKNAKAEGKRDLFFKEIEEENGEMQAGRKSFEI